MKNNCNICDDMDFMVLTVGLLKEILTDVPDEYKVTVQLAKGLFEDVISYDEDSTLQQFSLGVE